MRLSARRVLKDLAITLDKTSERKLQKAPEANQGHSKDMFISSTMLRGGMGSETEVLR
jgi:hypothetical protein